MENSSIIHKIPPQIISFDDRFSSLKAFDDSKTGVKGLADSRNTQIPHIFITNSVDHHQSEHVHTQFTVPVIDLKGVKDDRITRAEIVKEIRDASTKGGFFQIVNHGIPGDVTEEISTGIRKFHELENEVKSKFYSRDRSRRFIYNSNFDLYQAPSTNWRDSVECVLTNHAFDSDDLPHVCRDIMIKYSNYVKNLGITLFELISEALGLKSNHLKEMNCDEGLFLLGHYYPPCPQPELTMGFSGHTDSGFLTILLQDEIGGLQVQYENQWIDVVPLPDALVVNIADMLQLITNDMLKSSIHRVVPKKIGPRVSIACLFRTHFEEEVPSRLYGPIKELLSDEIQPIYREISMRDYITQRYNEGLNCTSTLSHFKLQKGSDNQL